MANESLLTTENQVENKIKIITDEVCLAGYDFGVLVYNEQAKGKLDLSQIFYIEFPEDTKKIATSFIQGFFAQIVNDIGLSETMERAYFICDNPKLSDRTVLLNKLYIKYKPEENDNV